MQKENPLLQEQNYPNEEDFAIF
jgi:hypothetical protein